MVKIEDLSVEYYGSTILKNVSIDIQEGCITALIGPSGCGKTTFLSCLNRLVDLTPGSSVKGQIMIDGLNLRDPKIDLMALRRRVGMVFQRPNPFPLSIFRNLDMPLREHGITDRHEIERRIEQALRDVGLWNEVKDQLGKSAMALSGGQQQRLCIARALILEPAILLMDEPCSALDPLSSAVVEDLIMRLRSRYTVLIVTHNLAQARRIANFVAFFWVRESAGTLVEFGHCQQIFEQPMHSLTGDYIRGKRG
ncbi:phosphate ABC transporter ATP-binding protein [Herbaspirillum sp. HC18]|nr:phosphate ABC transporter ATP-binding protein [Herbaspirillum sp. HC18]